MTARILSSVFSALSITNTINPPFFNATSDLDWMSTDASLPKVLMLFTGGTISMGSEHGRVDTTQYDGHPDLSISAMDLIARTPELYNISQLAVKNFAKDDETPDPVVLSLAKYANDALCSEGSDISGAIIIHGTNTLEETLFLVDHSVNCGKPVVGVGAMRPYTAMSFDGDMNLYQAVALAASPDARYRGAMIALNDRILPGYWATKTNANSLDTFKALEQGNLGTFVNGQPFFFNTPSLPMNKHTFDITTIEELPKVDILFAARQFDGRLIMAAMENGAKGVVIAGTGNGGLPSGREYVQEALDAGLQVVVGTRSLTGGATPLIAPTYVTAGYLSPAYARIQLQLCIASGYNLNQTRKVFEGQMRKVIGQELAY